MELLSALPLPDVLAHKRASAHAHTLAHVHPHALYVYHSAYALQPQTRARTCTHKHSYLHRCTHALVANALHICAHRYSRDIKDYKAMVGGSTPTTGADEEEDLQAPASLAAVPDCGVARSAVAAVLDCRARVR